MDQVKADRVLEGERGAMSDRILRHEALALARCPFQTPVLVALTIMFRADRLGVPNSDARRIIREALGTLRPDEDPDDAAPW